METKTMNLISLNMDELAGVINLYPWFGSARKELCRRMAEMGGDSWGDRQYSEQAMYLPDRSIIYKILRSSRLSDYSDKDIGRLLKTHIEDGHKPEISKETRKVRVVGGDFFSRAEYENVKTADDNVFSHLKSLSDDSRETQDSSTPELDFCTETLAQIYAEQGYLEQARRIYGKLILAFPEKSAYFASLIENLDKLINKQTS